MNKNFSKTISVVISVLLIFCLVEITALKDEISRLRSSLNYEMSQVNNTVHNIYNDVRDMLDEENNQLTISDWQYGNIDIAAKTAELVCTVIPKTYTPGITQVSLAGNNQVWPLTYENNQYTVRIELPLFDRSEITQVCLQENDTVYTQALNWVFEPRYEALLLCYAGMNGSSTYKKLENECIWSPAYGVQIDLERKGSFKIRSIELVEVLDGQEIGRSPIELSSEAQQEYAKAFSKQNQAYAVQETTPADFSNGLRVYNGYAHVLYFLDKDYHIPFGSMLEFYIDVVDEYGLRYRSFADCQAITDTGERDDLRMEEMQMYSFSEPIMIFDEHDNILYQTDVELFQ